MESGNSSTDSLTPQENDNADFQKYSDIPAIRNLLIFAQGYNEIHGYIALVLCIIGVVSNVINITILRKREMRSAVNLILLAIAASDLVLLIVYAPYVLTHGIFQADRFQHASTVYQAVLSVITMLAHGASVWFTVCLAAVRFAHLRSPPASQNIAMRHAIIAITVAVSVSAVISLPYIAVLRVKHREFNIRRGGWNKYGNTTSHNFLQLHTGSTIENYVTEVPTVRPPMTSDTVVAYDAASHFSNPAENTGQTQIEDIDRHDLAKPGDKASVKIYYYVSTSLGSGSRMSDGIYSMVLYWILGVFIKIGPAIVLSIFTVIFIVIIWKARQRRTRLFNKSRLSSAPASVCIGTGVNRSVAGQQESVEMDKLAVVDPHAATNGQHNHKQPKAGRSKRDRESQRATELLFAIALIFSLTMLPQGVLYLLSGLYRDFYFVVYKPLGNFLDVLSIINSVINLPLYCAMSGQFRQAFQKLYIDRCLCKK